MFFFLCLLWLVPAEDIYVRVLSNFSADDTGFSYQFAVRIDNPGWSTVSWELRLHDGPIIANERCQSGRCCACLSAHVRDVGLGTCMADAEPGEVIPLIALEHDGDEDVLAEVAGAVFKVTSLQERVWAGEFYQQCLRTCREWRNN